MTTKARFCGVGIVAAALVAALGGCGKNEDAPTVAEAPEAPEIEREEAPEARDRPLLAEPADDVVPPAGRRDGEVETEPVVEPSPEPPPAATPKPPVDAPSPIEAPPPGNASRAGAFTRLSPPDPAMFPDLKPLSPEHDVWIDAANQQVVMRGGVCLREGALELFACIHQWVEDKYAEGGFSRRGTKEYESVVTINTTAALVHAALLAVGAKEGSPAQFAPEYKPATGTVVEVILHWTGEDGAPRTAPAQQWVLNTRTQEAMEYPWVFAGSGFYVDPDTGERHYLGEEGNLICVSNFPDAVLDIPAPSPAENEALLFEAYTQNIPPLGTPVTIVLKPKLKDAGEGGGGESSR